MGKSARVAGDPAAVPVGDRGRMRRNVAELGDGMRSLDASVPSGVVVAAANLQDCFDRIAAESGLLTSGQAGVRMGSRAAAPRNAARAAHAAGRLLALRRGRYLLFPGFQFDQHGIRPAIFGLKAIARKHGWDDVAVTVWMISPTTYLAGKRPIDVIDDPTC